MISYPRLIAVICVLLAACGNVVGFDYRVASRDPQLSSAQILRVVTDALDRAEAGA